MKYLKIASLAGVAAFFIAAIVMGFQGRAYAPRGFNSFDCIQCGFISVMFYFAFNHFQKHKK